MPDRPSAPAPGGSAPERDAPPSGWVRLARLGRTYQLHGALRADPTGPAALDALRQLAAALGPVWLDGVGPTRLREARLVGAGLVLAFQGVYTPERARPLVHAHVWAEPDALPPAVVDPAAEGVDPARLEGAPVTRDGTPFGRVAYVWLGAQDLLVIDGPDGQRMVPWAAPYVHWDGTTVDLVDPPAGLVDPD